MHSSPAGDEIMSKRGNALLHATEALEGYMQACSPANGMAALMQISTSCGSQSQTSDALLQHFLKLQI
jgi:hypothetical protein